MAKYEALVKTRDNENRSLTEDEQARLLWKEGDIVAVRPKGWVWGRREVKEFLIVELPEDMTESEVELLCSAYHIEGEGVNEMGEIIEHSECVCRSRHCIDIDRLLARTGLGATKVRLQDMEDEYQPCQHTPISRFEISDKHKSRKYNRAMKDCMTRLRHRCEAESVAPALFANVTVRDKGLTIKGAR